MVLLNLRPEPTRKKFTNNIRVSSMTEGLFVWIGISVSKKSKKVGNSLKGDLRVRISGNSAVVLVRRPVPRVGPVFAVHRVPVPDHVPLNGIVAEVTLKVLNDK